MDGNRFSDSMASPFARRVRLHRGRARCGARASTESLNRPESVPVSGGLLGPVRPRGLHGAVPEVRAGRRAVISLLAAALAFCSMLFPGSSRAQSQSQQSARAKLLGQRLKCMCGGCGDTASSCNHTGGAFSGPCDTAKGMLKEAGDRLAAGSSDDLVLQSFVQEYGPTVLIEPPKAGFNLLAWIMPILLPILALIAVSTVVHRWRTRAVLAPAAGPDISPDLLARAHREAEKDSDE